MIHIILINIYSRGITVLVRQYLIEGSDAGVLVFTCVPYVHKIPQIYIFYPIVFLYHSGNDGIIFINTKIRCVERRFYYAFKL